VLPEVGPTGYSSLQVSDDSGKYALNGSVHDRVHATGVQAGMTSMKPVMMLNFDRFQEFSAVDQFQGTSIAVNYALKFSIIWRTH